MINVLHVITTIKRGGAENQLLVLIREQISQGFKVQVAYLKGEPELKRALIDAGADVLDDLVGISPVLQPLRIARLMSKERQVLHSHLPRAELIGFLVPKRFKFFVSRHNTEAFFPGASSIISVTLSRLVELRAHKVIAISNAVEAYLTNSGEIRKKEKIHVVHYGYNPLVERPKLNESVLARGIRIGTISRLVAQKDLPTLFLVFKEVLKIYPDSRLSILGEGELLDELKLLSIDLGIHDYVDFVGRSNQVLNYLSQLDVFILTSKYEGFGMVLLEAMDAGLPIVASRTSAIPEVLGTDFPSLCSVGEVEQFVSQVFKLTDKTYRQELLRIQEVRLKSFNSRIMGEKIRALYLS